MSNNKSAKLRLGKVKIGEHNGDDDDDEIAYFIVR